MMKKLQNMMLEQKKLFMCIKNLLNITIYLKKKGGKKIKQL